MVLRYAHIPIYLQIKNLNPKNLLYSWKEVVVTGVHTTVLLAIYWARPVRVQRRRGREYETAMFYESMGPRILSLGIVRNLSGLRMASVTDRGDGSRLMHCQVQWS